MVVGRGGQKDGRGGGGHQSANPVSLCQLRPGGVENTRDYKTGLLDRHGVALFNHLIAKRNIHQTLEMGATITSRIFGQNLYNTIRVVQIPPPPRSKCGGRGPVAVDRARHTPTAKNWQLSCVVARKPYPVSRIQGVSWYHPRSGDTDRTDGVGTRRREMPLLVGMESQSCTSRACGGTRRTEGPGVLVGTGKARGGSRRAGGLRSQKGCIIEASNKIIYSYNT